MILSGFLGSLATTYVLKELEKCAEKVDWVDLEKRIQALVEEIVPNAWLDAQAMRVVHVFLGSVNAGLKDETDLKAVLDDIVAEKWTDAAGKIKTLAENTLPSNIHR